MTDTPNQVVTISAVSADHAARQLAALERIADALERIAGVWTGQLPWAGGFSRIVPTEPDPDDGPGSSARSPVSIPSVAGEAVLQAALGSLLNGCIGWLRQSGYDSETIDQFAEIWRAKRAIVDASGGLRYLSVVQKARTVRAAANSLEGIHPGMLEELFGAVDALDGTD